jgi:pimeloyl-ACP methyl ester carboxylesterase/SAM-dependent methyltransferase
MDGQRIIDANGVALCVDTTGDAADPAILLIGGMGASMDWWEEEFCQRLAAGGRFVIRYDHRDTGRSVSYPAGRPGYTGADLAADAAGVLDALGRQSAHLAGVSMGGALAQLVTLAHPERVDSLVLISTSPAVPGGPEGPGRAELPPMAEDLRAYFAAEVPLPDWTERAAVIDYLVGYERRLEGAEYFDEAHVRSLVARIVDRSNDMAASVLNHALAEEGEPARGRLAEITAPTLVIHGTADPLFPYGHGEALAREIPGAGLLPLQGVGHQVPPRAWWTSVIAAMLRHTSGGWEAQGDRLASRSIAAGDPTGWFDRLYAAGAGGEVPMPWDRRAPHPMLVQWAQAQGLSGAGHRAIVVGCGLGADAEYVAGLGYSTVAFDVAETAVHTARKRHPGTTVDYAAADLLDPPARWLRAFDLVVEIITVQALPDPPRRTAIVNVGRLVAPGGTLIVIAARQDHADAHAHRPPWPLSREEIDAFATDGLSPVHIEELSGPRHPDDHRWRAEFRRPADAQEKG